jgi:hypothetical protein
MGWLGCLFLSQNLRKPAGVYLGVQVLPKLVCGRFMIYIYCYKKLHVCSMHLEAALRQPRRSLFFSLGLPYRACVRYEGNRRCILHIRVVGVKPILAVLRGAHGPYPPDHNKKPDARIYFRYSAVVSKWPVTPTGGVR